MTADNSQWDYHSLQRGISFLENAKAKLKADPLAIPSAVVWTCREIDQTIEFIEYNMREMEITDHNGD